MPRPLARRLQASLNRYTSWDGWPDAHRQEFPAPGFMDTAAERELVRRGLLTTETRQTHSGLPGIAMEVPIAWPTDEGWAAADHAPTAWQRRFLQRRTGACDGTWAVYRSCLARGWIEPDGPPNAGGTVRWHRTTAGLAASRPPPS